MATKVDINLEPIVIIEPDIVNESDSEVVEDPKVKEAEVK